MCGIFGILGTNNKPLLKKMARALVHRGPNDEGFFIDKNVEVGNRRLSIIDRAGGHQPIYNEDESACIVFNGEIYNYKSLRSQLEKKHSFSTNSDTEVILHLYEEFGLDFVKHLNGMFTFAIVDLKKKRVIMARDRVGIKPFYYYYDDKAKEFYFASELKALLENQDIPRSTSIEFVKEYLQFGFITSPNTMLAAVKKLPPGEMLVWDIKNRKLYQ